MKKRIAALLAVLMFFTMIPITAVPAYAANQENVIVSVPWEKINNCGHQAFSGPCQAYCWAYCRIILENQSHTYFDYWTGSQAKAPSAAGYVSQSVNMKSKQTLLETICNNVDLGRPVVVGVNGTPGCAHFVVAIGYKAGCNRNHLSESDILILDPANNVINATRGASETYTYLSSCTLTYTGANYVCWTATSGGTNITNTTSNGVATTPAPPATSKPLPPSATYESGKWSVTVPANYKLLLYSGEVEAASATYVSARSASYRVLCTKKATLSNGIVRYYGAFNTNDYYWLTYSNGMTVEDADAVKVHVVNFNANGGSVSPSYKQVTAGAVYGDLPTPTRNGYTFDGWYTAASGGTKVTASTTVNLSSNQITLYAHWIKDVSMDYTIETGLWDITIPANCPVTYYSGPGSMVVSGQEPGHSSAYRNVNFKTRAVLADGTIRFSFTEDKWFELTSTMSVEDRGNPSAYVTKYVNCYSYITCSTGSTVNLYKNPGDTTRYDYFSKGQSVNSPTYILMSDGSKWYQVNVFSAGNSMDLWLRGDGNVSITTRHTYGAVQYETAHPHKGYQVCECGQVAYTETNTKLDSCADCKKVSVKLELGTIGPKVPAESIIVTNGYRYLYVYKPTGEVVKQIGGDVYEVHMTPGSTYQLNTVVAPSNTTDHIQYSVRYPNNNPSNGGGVSVSKTGLITANNTAHGNVIVEITCGDCKTQVYIIMCTPTGERL